MQRGLCNESGPLSFSAFLSSLSVCKRVCVFVSLFVGRRFFVVSFAFFFGFWPFRSRVRAYVRSASLSFEEEEEEEEEEKEKEWD